MFRPKLFTKLLVQLVFRRRARIIVGGVKVASKLTPLLVMMTAYLFFLERIHHVIEQTCREAIEASVSWYESICRGLKHLINPKMIANHIDPHPDSPISILGVMHVRWTHADEFYDHAKAEQPNLMIVFGDNDHRNVTRVQRCRCQASTKADVGVFIAEISDHSPYQYELYPNFRPTSCNVELARDIFEFGMIPQQTHESDLKQTQRLDRDLYTSQNETVFLLETLESLSRWEHDRWSSEHFKSERRRGALGLEKQRRSTSVIYSTRHHQGI